MMSRCYVAPVSTPVLVTIGSTTRKKVSSGPLSYGSNYTDDSSGAAQVEIHLLQLDCQVCGSEINPDREEYIGRTRVCPRCFEALTTGADRKARQRKIKKRGGSVGY
ncbi:hypothetical protein D3C80_1631960 [compost metagenome]